MIVHVEYNSSFKKHTRTAEIVKTFKCYLLNSHVTFSESVSHSHFTSSESLSSSHFTFFFWFSNPFLTLPLSKSQSRSHFTIFWVSISFSLYLFSDSPSFFSLYLFLILQPFSHFTFFWFSNPVLTLPFSETLSRSHFTFLWVSISFSLYLFTDSPTLFSLYPFSDSPTLFSLYLFLILQTFLTLPFSESRSRSHFTFFWVSISFSLYHFFLILQPFSHLTSF